MQPAVKAKKSAESNEVSEKSDAFKKDRPVDEDTEGNGGVPKKPESERIANEKTLEKAKQLQSVVKPEVPQGQGKVEQIKTNMAISAQERAFIKKSNGILAGSEKEGEKNLPSKKSAAGKALDEKRGLKVEIPPSMKKLDGPPAPKEDKKKGEPVQIVAKAPAIKGFKPLPPPPVEEEVKSVPPPQVVEEKEAPTKPAPKIVEEVEKKPQPKPAPKIVEEAEKKPQPKPAPKIVEEAEAPKPQP